MRWWVLAFLPGRQLFPQGEGEPGEPGRGRGCHWWARRRIRSPALGPAWGTKLSLFLTSQYRVRKNQGLERNLNVRAGITILVVLFGLLFLNNIIIFIYVGSRYLHTTAQAWRSEDSLWELGLRSQAQIFGLAASIFNHWSIPLASPHLQYQSS